MPEFAAEHAGLAPQQSGCCIDPHLVAVPILLPARDDRGDNLLSVRQLGDASQGCHHQLLLVLQLGSILQALQAAPTTWAKVLAAGLRRVVVLAQGALLHCRGMACTTIARNCAQQHPEPARCAERDRLALADCRAKPLRGGRACVSQESGARKHSMSGLACLHAGDLCQQDLSRQCALAEDDHAAVMPADTL